MKPHLSMAELQAWADRLALEIAEHREALHEEERVQ
jgi:hypothetical protein